MLLLMPMFVTLYLGDAGATVPDSKSQSGLFGEPMHQHDVQTLSFPSPLTPGLHHA